MVEERDDFGLCAIFCFSYRFVFSMHPLMFGFRMNALEEGFGGVFFLDLPYLRF
jgi:hypothetical protein